MPLTTFPPPPRALAHPPGVFVKNLSHRVRVIYTFRLFPSRHLYFFPLVRYHSPPNGTIEKPHHSQHKEHTMGKSQDARKETKKKPAKTMKEKRAEKKGKK